MIGMIRCGLLGQSSLKEVAKFGSQVSISLPSLPLPQALQTDSEIIRVYDQGDTGYKSIPRGVPIEEEDKYPYCPAFKEIGEREGPFDLGMIPIGAYDPRWFMSRVSFEILPCIRSYFGIRGQN